MDRDRATGVKGVPRVPAPVLGVFLETLALVIEVPI